MISIHAPARGATKEKSAPARISSFQSTLPRGERPIASANSLAFLVFQSTLPRGERQKRGIRYEAMNGFQSTLPRGERPHCCISSTFSINFNPRSREGSDINGVSSLPSQMANFNPRSREGSDNITFFKFSILNINFNPRSREGSDGISCRIFGFYYFISIHAPARGATQHHHYILSQDMEISIHAPARGATRLFSGKFFAIFNFNPRSREGSDPLSVHRPHHLSAFQSTLPRGERR